MIRITIVIDASRMPYADVQVGEAEPSEEDKIVASVLSKAIECAFEAIAKANGGGTIISLDGFVRDLRNRLDPPAS
jgi:hypothetical protein